MNDGTILVVDDKPENIRLLFEALQAGGVDYLTKPLQHEEVLARVRAHLVRERLWREVSVYSRREKESAAQRRREERTAWS
jgi:DNA-binding response OmpR family regulator